MIREYREAIVFLVKYVAIYLVLNTVYAYYVEYHAPDADPVTIIATRHTQRLLALFDPEITTHIPSGSVDVPLLKNGVAVMTVYEGCNSVNVMIVFVAFIIAFRGPVRLFVRYLVLGLIIVYAVNLLRLMGLYGVARYLPETFYFFHKFFFTGAIYLVVFALWYAWVLDLKKWKSKETQG